MRMLALVWIEIKDCATLWNTLKKAHLHLHGMQFVHWHLICKTLLHLEPTFQCPFWYDYFLSFATFLIFLLCSLKCNLLPLHPSPPIYILFYMCQHLVFLVNGSSELHVVLIQLVTQLEEIFYADLLQPLLVPLSLVPFHWKEYILITGGRIGDF